MERVAQKLELCDNDASKKYEYNILEANEICDREDTIANLSVNPSEKSSEAVLVAARLGHVDLYLHVVAEPGERQRDAVEIGADVAVGDRQQVEPNDSKTQNKISKINYI